MKYSILIVLFATMYSLPTLAQRSPENMFRKYKNHNSALFLETKGDFVKFPLNEDGTQRSKISRVEVIAFGENEGMNKQEKSDFIASLLKFNYELLAQVKNPEVKADIYVLGDLDFVEEAFGIIQAKGFDIYARLSGKIYLEDLQSMDMNIDGASNVFGMFGN